jgi:hypothetical protein
MLGESLMKTVGPLSSVISRILSLKQRLEDYECGLTSRISRSFQIASYQVHRDLTSSSLKVKAFLPFCRFCNILPLLLHEKDVSHVDQLRPQ